MDLKFGDHLKNTRVEKGLSLEDVSDELKINLKTLKKLESSETNGLPKPPFTKGFIKSYCHYLEMDSRPVIDAYNLSLDEKDLSLGKGVLIEDQGSDAVFALDYFRDKIFPVTVLFICLVGAFFTYSFLKKTPLSSSSEPREMAIVETVPTKEKAEVLEKKPEPSKSTEPVKEIKVSHVSTVYGEDEKKENEKKKNDVKVVKPLSFENKLVVEPLAKTYLYIKTNLDDEPVRATLKPDKKRVFKFDSAEIRFLDAGAVKVILNGKDLGAIGGFGEAKKIEFPSLKGL